MQRNPKTHFFSPDNIALSGWRKDVKQARPTCRAEDKRNEPTEPQGGVIRARVR